MVRNARVIAWFITDIRSEIDKRKLFFLGMLIINSSVTLDLPQVEAKRAIEGSGKDFGKSSVTPVYKVMFYRRLIRWK